MATTEGNWWSRAWGAVATLGFALHLGAALYEAVVVAPLWSNAVPKSVVAWAMLQRRPDSSLLFHPLVGVIVAATALAWISGIATRGWRRWWLTLSLVAAGALAAVTLLMMLPCERELFGAAALGDGSEAVLTALAGDWLRAAALRFAALGVGAWAAHRAQLAGAAAASPVPAREARSRAAAGDYTLGRGAAKGRRSRDFALGDEAESEMVLGDDDANPRDRWRSSLPRGRRTAKK